MILRGVSVGHEAIIVAGTVVKHDISVYEIWNVLVNERD